MLRELAPWLAEDGIDVDNIDVPDLATLQRALDRAVQRRDLQRFNPVGPAHGLAVTTLRRAVEAILTGDTTTAAALLDQVKPESPDHATATVASCLGIALGLLDTWLSAPSTDAPAALSQDTVLPPGHWHGERAATDILALARKGRAFHSLDRLLLRQGGPQVLAGCTLALAAATAAWARRAGTPIAELIPTAIR